MTENIPRIKTGAQDVQETLEKLFKHLVRDLGYDRERAKRVITEEVQHLLDNN